VKKFHSEGQTFPLAAFFIAADALHEFLKNEQPEAFEKNAGVEFEKEAGSDGVLGNLKLLVRGLFSIEVFV